MFVAYQRQKDEQGNDFMHAAFLNENEENLRNMPFVVIDEIKEVEFAVMYNGKIYEDESEYNNARKESVRQLRNSLLTEEVDPVVTNPLRWSDMSEEDQNMYKNYRKYLLDYTEQENWWEQNPKTLEEWRAE